MQPSSQDREILNVDVNAGMTLVEHLKGVTKSPREGVCLLVLALYIVDGSHRKGGFNHDELMSNVDQILQQIDAAANATHEQPAGFQ